MNIKKFAGLLAGIALSIGTVSVASAGAASAVDRGPDYPTAEFAGISVPSNAGAVIFFADVQPGTTVRIIARSCTGTNADIVASVPTNGNGVLVANSSRPGPTTYYDLTYSLVGKLDFAANGYNRPTPNPASCSSTGGGQVTKAITSKHIKKWSTKKKHYTKAKVGKRVKVNKTYLKSAGKGMKVSYRWYAGGKVVDKDRSYKVSKKFKGKTLKMKVTLSKSGYSSRTKTLNFGKIKK